jgi:hypothetical protein
MEGTPSARPISWTVAQVNTEVKRLRTRAEQLLYGATVGIDTAALGTLSAMKKRSGSGDSYTRAQLLEAIALIHEQDRLIHQGLYVYSWFLCVRALLCVYFVCGMYVCVYVCMNV